MWKEVGQVGGGGEGGLIMRYCSVILDYQRVRR